jgi:hypothetical protein
LLRIKPSNGPYRHYKLTVRDPFIGSLEVGMPYSIFINTGEIKNVEYTAVFIDSGKNDGTSSYEPIDKYTEDNKGFCVTEIPHPKLMKKEGKPLPDEAWIIILIESFDDFLDQTNITKKVYDYLKIKNEEFTDIESKLETARREESSKKIKEDKAEGFDKNKFKKSENSFKWCYNKEEIDVEDNENVEKIKKEIKNLTNADKPYNIFDKDEIDKYFDSFGEVNRDKPSL